MPRTKAVSPEQASGKVAEMYSALNNKLGSVPNIFQHMAASPAVLEAYLGLSATAGGLSLIHI